MPEIRTRTTVTYEIERGPPLETLADALVATARLHRIAAAFLQQAVPGTSLEILDMRVEEIRPGSWREVVMLSAFVAFQEKLEATVPPLIETLLGVDIPKGYEPLAVVLTVFLLSGAFDALVHCVKTGFPLRRAAHAKREAVERLAPQLGLTPEELEDALSAFLEGKRRTLVRRASVRFLRPAAEAGGRPVRVGDAVVPGEVVAALPADEAEEDEIEIEAITDTEVELLAHDLERRGRGWAAAVPAISPRRARLVLAVGVDPAELFTARRVRGDVTVETVTDETGEIVPRRIVLTRVHRIIE